MEIKQEDRDQFQVYTRKEIFEQLERILSNKKVSGSTVICNFLKFIVQETLEGNTATLKEYTIAVSALGKSSSFNPQIDAIVRIHAGRLRRLLKEYYSGPGKNDPINIEVIKGSYVPVFRTQTIQSLNGKAHDGSDISGYSRSKLTLAVLPFRNLCPDNKYQFFVDGFGEELTRMFSTSQDIAVIAHHSSRKYFGSNTDIRVIGYELGVHYVITGTVRRTSTEVRVSIGLVEALNGTQIWSKIYKHALQVENLIEIQDHINDDIFAKLSGLYGFIIRSEMIERNSQKKLDMATFDAVLWNYHIQMTHSLEACNTARKALEKVIHHEPNYVTGLVLLADLYVDSYTLGYPTIENPVNEALKLVSKAIKLDPYSKNANMIYAWVNIHLGRKKEAIEAIDYTIQLGHLSASIKGVLGFGLACTGEYKRAHSLLTESLKLNPYCPWWYYMGLCFINYQSAQYEKALDNLEKMDASDDVFFKPLLKCAALGQLGMLEKAHAEMETLHQKFQPIVDDLNTHLDSIILDKSLSEGIIEGAQKGGLTLA